MAYTVDLEKGPSAMREAAFAIAAMIPDLPEKWDSNNNVGLCYLDPQERSWVMEGIGDKSPHYDELDKNNIDSKAVESLPSSLEEALEIAKESDFLKRVIPESVLSSYFEEKEKEIASCKSASDYYKKGRQLFFERL